MDKSNAVNPVFSVSGVTGAGFNQTFSGQELPGGRAAWILDSAQGAEREDHIIPSNLKQAADVTQQLQQSFQELEEATNRASSGKFDLLLEALMKDKNKTEKRKVKWPQEQALKGTMRKRPTTDDESVDPGVFVYTTRINWSTGKREHDYIPLQILVGILVGIVQKGHTRFCYIEL